MPNALLIKLRLYSFGKVSALLHVQLYSVRAHWIVLCACALHVHKNKCTYIIHKLQNSGCLFKRETNCLTNLDRD